MTEFNVVCTSITKREITVSTSRLRNEPLAFHRVVDRGRRQGGISSLVQGTVVLDFSFTYYRNAKFIPLVLSGLRL